MTRAKTDSANELLKSAAVASAAAGNLQISLICALEGLTQEIADQRREQREMTTHLISVLDRLEMTQCRLELTTRGLTDELTALRVARTHGGNGHAIDDDITAEHPHPRRRSSDAR